LRLIELIENAHSARTPQYSVLVRATSVGNVSTPLQYPNQEEAFRYNSMWKLEQEGFYFKIYDKGKNIAGYFAPEYGDIYPEDKADEVIEQMLKRHDKIKSGYLMLPMVKFGIFEEAREMNLDYLFQQLDSVKERLSTWERFMSNKGTRRHKIMVSHTDHDMLSITFEIAFSSPIELEKNVLQNELEQTLDLLQSMSLL